MRQHKQVMLALTLLGITLLLTVPAGSALHAHPGDDTVQQAPPPPPPGGPIGRVGFSPRLLEQLGLTGDQKTQISSLLDTLRTDTQSIHDELMQAHDSIRAAVEATTYDDGAIVAQAVVVGQAMAELTVRQAQTEWSIYQLFTAEQRTKLAELRKQMGPPPR
jgi:Spy/CpxP family protein refolding chaperone